MIFIPLYYFFGFYNVPTEYDHICYDLTAGKDWFMSETREEARLYYQRSVLPDVGFHPTSPKETVPKLLNYLKWYIKDKQKNATFQKNTRAAEELLETDTDRIYSELYTHTRGLVVDGTAVYKAFAEMHLNDDTPFDQYPANKVRRHDFVIKLRKPICDGLDAVCSIFNWWVEYKALGDEDPDDIVFDCEDGAYWRQKVYCHHKPHRIFVDYATLCPPLASLSDKEGYSRHIVRGSIDAELISGGLVVGKRFSQAVPLDGSSQHKLKFTERSRIGVIQNELIEGPATFERAEQIIYHLLNWI